MKELRMELRKITFDNLYNIASLSVAEDQKSFVASNCESLMEAYVAVSNDEVALPFGIFDGDTPVGFIMFGYGAADYDDEPEVADGNYCIWRLMIDQKYQNKGYGREAMKLALAYLETEPCGKASACWLSYEPENTKAKALYKSFGFVENGEMSGNEIVAVRYYRRT